MSGWRLVEADRTLLPGEGASVEICPGVSLSFRAPEAPRWKFWLRWKRPTAKHHRLSVYVKDNR